MNLTKGGEKIWSAVDEPKLEGKAVILLSGGLDSATVLAWAVKCGAEVTALSFLYGQKHQKEVERAKALGVRWGVKRHFVFSLDLAAFGGSSLLGWGDIPKEGLKEGIPSTYVPFRNAIFLSLGVALAESEGAKWVMGGMNAVDFSGYPDCRPEFLEAFQRAVNTGTKRGVSGESIIILAPLLHMKKSEIIKRGMELGVDYGMTWSCYDPLRDTPCGTCDSCRIRKRGFSEAGEKDPLLNGKGDTS